MSLTYSRIFTAAGVIAALAIATPALAGQGRARGRSQDQQSAQQTRQPEGRARREEARPPAPAARPSPPPQVSSSPRQRESARSQTPPPQPTSSSRQRESARVQVPAPQPQFQPQTRGGSQGHAIPRPSPRVDANPPDRRHDVRPVIVAPRHVVVAPRHVIVAPRPAWGYFHRGYIAPIRVVRYYQPYYVFQPRARFFFGLSIGYPVAYPVWYDPYPYYGYAIGPRYGGISFDIEPTDAAVFIDGDYVGCVDDFSPYDAPLTLRAGFHRVELRARGWQPMRFDITIAAGQVIPYRGALGYVQ